MQFLSNRICEAPDGGRLATDVYLPDGRGPWPVVLMRTPYNKVGQLGRARRYVAAGYAYVAQDCRGRYESVGRQTPFLETADSGAAVAWVAEQRWCNGRIGMVGGSYCALVQYGAASHGHPALRCIAPNAIMGDLFGEWSRLDGCFALATTVRWSLANASCQTTPVVPVDWETIWAQRTLGELFAVAGQEWGFIQDIVAHETVTAGPEGFWECRDLRRLAGGIGVPSLHLDGWFDHCNSGSSGMYTRLGLEGRSAAARAGRRLVIGPWGHMSYGQSSYAGVAYGEAAALDVEGLYLSWLDLWLRDVDDGIGDSAPVRLWVTGENRWRVFADWPVPGTEAVLWYLDADGPATGRGSGGRLARSGATGEAMASYVYDPLVPLRSRGGPLYWGLAPEQVGQTDVAGNLERADVLLYQTPVLEADCTVVGEMALCLWLQPDAEDTDVVVRLVEIDAAGGMVCLSVGQTRAAYREGYDRLVAIPRDTPVRLAIRLQSIAHRVPAGARLGLQITSSDYPRILPHPNTLERPFSPAPPRSAVIRILHSRECPSTLSLPVLPAAALADG